MLFNSIDFIIFFVIILAIISAIRYRKFQHVFLLTASYFFFYYSSNYLITLLIASTILDFYIGKAIWSSTNITRKKILLSVSLAGNLGLLGFFKYADFAVTQFNLFGNHFNLTSQMKAGIVWANSYNKFDPTSPFGGYKESGFGREGGLHGLKPYLNL